MIVDAHKPSIIIIIIMKQRKFSEMSSNTVSMLRFPLMVGIVFIHCSLLKGIKVQGVNFCSDMPYWLICVQTMLSEVIPRIGVPLFFLISGYLFFYSGLTGKLYKTKLLKRTRTLLVPYILWNTIFLGYSAVRTLPIFATIFPNMVDGNWSIYSILETFWNVREGVFANPNAEVSNSIIFPQDGPMWYVRDLIIIMVASPIIFFAIKKIGWFVVVALGLTWYFIMPFDLGHTYQLMTAAFFFSWGAFYAIRGIDFVVYMRKYNYALWIYVPIAITDMLTKEYSFNCYIHNAGIIVGIYAAVWITATLLESKKIKANKFLTDSSFFIFALHTLFTSDLTKLIVRFTYINSPLYIVLLYFLIPTITIFVCLSIYWLLQRFAPHLCALITGGR